MHVLNKFVSNDSDDFMIDYELFRAQMPNIPFWKYDW